ncbi:cuticle protein 10.9-like [Tropilaelaps mercedesae]|uniref:Cuticle protein 10.9-like n=1 Tax=Tropilaelaps mercedesae TaxID=418985 RepID=A0A1V9Y3J3_9ACAR|nr:cuticle protein 10.9-like [Tropilaelaps mercedesae]
MELIIYDCHEPWVNFRASTYSADDTGSYEPQIPYQYMNTGREGLGSGALALANGRQKTVTYEAEDSGFHAYAITNELGTESKNPADVTIQSSTLTGTQAASETRASYRRKA